MDTQGFIEKARKISFEVILFFLIPYLGYYTARFIVHHVTGLTLWEKHYKTMGLYQELRELDTKRYGMKGMLKKGDLVPEERFVPEQKIQSIDQHYEHLKKELDVLEVQNAAMRAKQELMLFGIMILFGLLSMGLGSFTKFGYLRAGFMSGGTLSIVCGFISYWYPINGLLCLGVLIAAIAAIFSITYGLTRRK